MMGWYNDSWGSGNWLAMGLMMFFWVALIALAVWAGIHLLRADSATKASPQTTLTPRATLDQRLAAGEIDAEQYAQLRRLLDGQSVASTPTDTPAHP